MRFAYSRTIPALRPFRAGYVYLTNRRCRFVLLEPCATRGRCLRFDLSQRCVFVSQDVFVPCRQRMAQRRAVDFHYRAWARAPLIHSLPLSIRIHRSSLEHSLLNIGANAAVLRNRRSPPPHLNRWALVRFSYSGEQICFLLWGDIPPWNKLEPRLAFCTAAVLRTTLVSQVPAIHFAVGASFCEQTVRFRCRGLVPWRI